MEMRPCSDRFEPSRCGCFFLATPLWAQRVLYEDRFRTEPEWRTERSRGRPRDGAFEMESRLYDTHGFYDDSSRLHAYYRISVTAEYRGGPATSGYGLFLASPAERSSGEKLEIRQDGMFRISNQPWQATDVLRLGRGEVNTLTAENRAGEVTFLVNGREIARWRGPGMPTGYSGVSVMQDLTVRFRDYRIELLPVPEPAPGSLDDSLVLRRLLSRYSSPDGIWLAQGNSIRVTARSDHIRDDGTRWLPARVRLQGSWTRLGGPPGGRIGLTFGKYADVGPSVRFLVYGSGEYELLRRGRSLIERQRHPAVRTGTEERNDLGVEIRGPRRGQGAGRRPLRSHHHAGRARRFAAPHHGTGGWALAHQPAGLRRGHLGHARAIQRYHTSSAHGTAASGPDGGFRTAGRDRRVESPAGGRSRGPGCRADQRAGCGKPGCPLGGCRVSVATCNAGRGTLRQPDDFAAALSRLMGGADRLLLLP